MHLLRDVEQPYTPSLTDTRCLVTTEAIMLDGANSVCGASRRPELWRVSESSALFFAVVLSVLVAAVLVKRRRAWIPRAVVLLAVLGSLPGLRAVLFTRADAPGRVRATASAVAHFDDELVRFLAGRKVVTLQNDCLECEAPLLFAEQGRLPQCRLGPEGLQECLVPPNRIWGTPDGALILHPDALRGDCVIVGNALTCGR